MRTSSTTGIRRAPGCITRSRARPTMNTERWRVLSEWHNTWLSAPTEQRTGLRASFATEHPELLRRWPTSSPPPVRRSTGFSKRLPWSSPPGSGGGRAPLPEGTGRTARIVALLARGGMRCLPGSRSAARSRCRAQDARQRGARRWARGRTVPAGSPDHRITRPPQHRQSIRRRDVERSAALSRNCSTARPCEPRSREGRSLRPTHAASPPP